MATSHLPGLMEFEARSLFDPDTQRLVKLERQRLGNLPRSSVSIATLDRDLEQLLIAEQRLLEELRQLRSKFTYKPDDDSSAIYRHFGPVVNGLESSLKQFLAIFPNEIEPWLETAPAADSRALSVAVASAFSTCQQLQKVLDVFTASKHYHESLQESLENMEREYESLSAETLPQPSADSPAPAFGHLVARMFSEIETCTAILNRRQA
ncbi:uncharacterized protein BJ171DRAFT_238130 [Polychytrium aggregatum]|uniref:uncharacterized protein n=1 Tax=Polychytrium aggregatum TaxID=110093 RepID=UPI0022FE10AA|nr:uncharacterized protein BJ171DRAFT_238130 [Polychytrium aggregatum]KAI9208316.1 hypothetical protein BJ171DRAFT_238130 [Polychytrium aggregatum]